MTIIWADHKMSDEEIDELAYTLNQRPGMQLTHPYRVTMVCIFLVTVVSAVWKWWV